MQTKNKRMFHIERNCIRKTAEFRRARVERERDGGDGCGLLIYS